MEHTDLWRDVPNFWPDDKKWCHPLSQCQNAIQGNYQLERSHH